jgi:hypothetical protein
MAWVWNVPQRPKAWSQLVVLLRGDWMRGLWPNGGLIIDGVTIGPEYWEVVESRACLEEVSDWGCALILAPSCLSVCFLAVMRWVTLLHHTLLLPRCAVPPPPRTTATESRTRTEIPEPVSPNQSFLLLRSPLRYWSQQWVSDLHISALVNVSKLV